MNGWSISNSMKANKHWQSGNGGVINLLNKNTLPKPLRVQTTSSIAQDPISTVLINSTAGGSSIYAYMLHAPSSQPAYMLPCGYLEGKTDITDSDVNSAPWLLSKYVKNTKKDISTINTWYAVLTVKTLPKEWKDKNIYVVRSSTLFAYAYMTGSYVRSYTQQIFYTSEYNVTGLDYKLINNDTTFTGIKVDINKPIVWKMTFNESQQYERVGVGIMWGSSTNTSLRFICDGNYTEAMTLSGSFNIKYELLTEEEYNERYATQSNA